MNKTGKEIVLRENSKSFFVHVANVIVHRREMWTRHLQRGEISALKIEILNSSAKRWFLNLWAQMRSQRDPMWMDKRDGNQVPDTPSFSKEEEKLAKWAGRNSKWGRKKIRQLWCHWSHEYSISRKSDPISYSYQKIKMKQNEKINTS